MAFFPYLCFLKTSNMQKQYNTRQEVWCPHNVQLGTVAYFGLYTFIVKHNFVTGSETLHETRVESKHPNQIFPVQREQISWSVSNAKLWAIFDVVSFLPSGSLFASIWWKLCLVAAVKQRALMWQRTSRGWCIREGTSHYLSRDS